MPIVGFLRQRLPRLGKIRLGEKAISPKSGKEYPKDTEHFNVPEDVAEVYGDAPTELDIMVPCVDIEQWFPFSLKRYGMDRLLCRGNGEIATCFNEQTGEWDERPCAYHDCEFYQAKKCTEVGNLMVVLPKVNIFGVYQIDTGSWHGINNVYNAYNAFLQRVIDITGDPTNALRVQFRLVRQKQTLEYTDGGTRKTVEKCILNLIPPTLTFDGALQLAAQYRERQALAPAAHMPALPPSEDELPYDREAPEPDEAQPTDLYPNAAPVGPDMGLQLAWDALLEQVSALGKNEQAAVKSVLKQVDREASAFKDLSETDAAAAIDKLTAMVKNWHGEGAAPKQSPDPEPVAAAATADAQEGLSF